jgi:hypothetical protein
MAGCRTSAEALGSALDSKMEWHYIAQKAELTIGLLNFWSEQKKNEESKHCGQNGQT